MNTHTPAPSHRLAGCRQLLRELARSARPRAARPHQRQGAALIIALFALLAITGLGLVAVQTASEEIQASGNHRFNQAGERVSAGALDIALANVATNGTAIWNLMKQQAVATATADDVDVVDIATTYTFDDTTLKSQFFIGPGGDANTLTPQMSVTMKDPVDGFTVPGYSTDFCFKRFQFQANATIGTQPTDLDTLDPHVRYSSAEHHATGVLGPIECEGN